MKGSRHILIGAVLVCSSLRVFAGPTASSLDLDRYRGKVVYLDFWASWCGPCRQSFPWLSDIQSRFGPNKVVIIGINVDHDREKAERFLKETASNFTILYDPQGQVATRYHVKAMPSSFLIDATGRVRYEHQGFSTKEIAEYEEQIATLLAEEPSK